MSVDNLDAIEQRNARVETDKAWETSWTRRLVIIIGTYLIVLAYLNYIGISQAHFHAAVPAGAYLMSTLTLPFLKKLWIKGLYKKAQS